MCAHLCLWGRRCLWRCQKRASEPLELKLQTVVSHQTCIWNTTGSSATPRALNQNQCSSPQKSMVLWDKMRERHWRAGEAQVLRPSCRRHFESTAITFSIVLPLIPHTGERQTEKQHDYNLLTFFTAATELRKASWWAGSSRKLNQFSVMGLTWSDISSAQEALTLLSAEKMHSRVNAEPDQEYSLYWLVGTNLSGQGNLNPRPSPSLEHSRW